MQFFKQYEFPTLCKVIKIFGGVLGFDIWIGYFQELLNYMKDMPLSIFLLHVHILK